MGTEPGEEMLGIYSRILEWSTGHLVESFSCQVAALLLDSSGS